MAVIITETEVFSENKTEAAQAAPASAKTEKKTTAGRKKKEEKDADNT